MPEEGPAYYNNNEGCQIQQPLFDFPARLEECIQVQLQTTNFNEMLAEERSKWLSQEQIYQTRIQMLEEQNKELKISLKRKKRAYKEIEQEIIRGYDPPTNKEGKAV